MGETKPCRIQFRIVRCSDKDRIICWYRPQRSRTYHVIYGDLSVRHLAYGCAQRSRLHPSGVLTFPKKDFFA